MIAAARTLNPRDGLAAAGPQPCLATTVSPAEVPNETTATTQMYSPPGRARRQTVKTHSLPKNLAGAMRIEDLTRSTKVYVVNNLETILIYYCIPKYIT